MSYGAQMSHLHNLLTQKEDLLKKIDDRIKFWEDFYKKMSLKVVKGITNEADVARYVFCEELRKEIKGLK